MSVWSNCVTKIGTAKAIFSSNVDLFRKVYKGRVYPMLDPDFRATGWTRETTWEEVAYELDWVAAEEESGSMFLEDLKPLERVKVGLEAYFEIISAVMKGSFKGRPACNHARIEETIATMVRFLAPSTQINASKFTEACLQKDDATLACSHMWYDAADLFKLLKNSRKWEDQNEEYVDASDNWISENSPYAYRKVGKVHVFLGKGPYASKAAVLTDSGLDLVIAAVERISALYEYSARAFAKKPVKLALVHDLLTFQVSRAAEVRGRSADKVAKAWHEAKTYVQYKTLKSIMTDAVDAIEAEYVTDGFSDIVPLDVAARMMTGPDDVTTMELVHVYKWIPPPEYDMTKALPIIRDLHEAPRVSGANPSASKEKTELYELIRAERKMNLLSAYKRMSGDYPENLVKKGSKPTIVEASEWDHTALLRYEQMGKHISAQIKDKTTVKARMEEEIRSVGKGLDQNYLTWFLLNWDKLDTRDMLEEFSTGTLKEDAYSRVAYKPESQKVDSRPFFMAPPIRRTLLAEFEGNLSKIARFYPATLIGKGDAASAAMMDEAMDPHSTNDTLSPDDITTTFIVMFDVSKWSPKSDGAQVQDYHTFWAEVYGDARLAKLKTIGCDDVILNTTDDVVFSYKNKGADLEGYRGRMGTMYHADMLGAVCRRAINKKYIAGKSNLVVFIDDGAVKIEAVGTGKEAEANARSFLEVLKEVYSAGGQEVHDRKVVISKRGGEILANFYLEGVKVPQGLKAAMKITPDYSNPVASLVDANDSAFASAQGALKAGAPLFTTYSQYLSSILKNVYRFNRKGSASVSHLTMTLLAYTPKSFGGLGVQSLQGLCTTCVTNITAEGMSILNRAARMYPDVRAAVKTIITQPVLRRDPLSILRDPLRLSHAGPTLVESRLVRYVVSHLIEKEPLMARLVQGASADSLVAHATSVADNLLSGDSISVPLMQRAWSATPLSQVETVIGKFERSESIIKFLGYKVVGKIRRANIGDVLKITEQMKLLVNNI